MAEKRGLFSFSKSNSDNVVDKLMQGNRLISEANSELMEKSKQKDNELNQLIDNIRELNKKHGLLKQQLYEKDNLSENYIKEINILKKGLLIKKEETKTNKERISHELNEKNDEIGVLKNKLNSMNNKFSDYIPKKEHSLLKQQLDAKDKLCHNYLDEIESYKNNLTLKKEEVVNLKHKLEGSISERNDFVRKKKHEMIELKNKTDLFIKGKSKEADTLSKKLSILNKETSASKFMKKIEVLKQQLYDKEKLCNYYASEINTLKEELNITESEVSSVRKQILDRSITQKGKIKELGKKLEEKFDRIDDLKQQLFEKNKQISDNNEKIVVLHQNLGLKDKDVDSFKREVIGRDQHMAQLHEKINILIKTISEKDEYLEALKIQLVKQDDTTIKLSNDAVALKQSSNNFKEKTQQLTLENAELSEELERLRYELNKYKSLLHETEKKQKMIISEFNNKFKNLILD